MGHHHHNSTKNIRIAFLLNLSFTVLEIFGGFWTNSMAILSDAVHDLGDSLSLGLALYLDKKSKQEKDNKFSFGYQRFSLLGALINGGVLISGSIYIFMETIPRLFHPEQSNAEGMFVFAIFGILVNGIAALRMKDGKSLNERMVSWHLWEDVLGWFVILIVSVVLYFRDIPILDPALSILILLFVLFNVMRNLKETFMIFLQGVPSDTDLQKIEDDIKSLENVHSVHQTQIWSLDGEKHVLSVHVIIKEVSEVSEIVQIKQQIRAILKEVPVRHATIEIEFEDEDCYMDSEEK